VAPPRKEPMATEVHWVVWVSELAVWSSSLEAMAGRTEARPEVKKGEANMRAALNPSSSVGFVS